MYAECRTPEKTVFTTFLDLNIPEFGSVFWRFQSAFGGKKSPNQCPGLVEDRQGERPGAHSSYREGIGKAWAQSFSQNGGVFAFEGTHLSSNPVWRWRYSI